MIVFATRNGTTINYFDSRWAHEHVLPRLMSNAAAGLLVIVSSSL